MNMLSAIKVARFSRLLPLGVGIGLGSKTLHADEEEKKSIYSNNQKISRRTDEETKKIDIYSKKIREEICGLYKEVMIRGKDMVEKWIAFEKKSIEIIKSTIPDTERFMPAALYISLATLSGPILFRKSSLVKRYLSTSTLFVGSMAYLLPDTTAGLVKKTWYKLGSEESYEKVENEVKLILRHRKYVWTFTEQKTSQLRDALSNSK